MRRLPEDCVAKILSWTSPEDTCRLSLVSTTFHSASESDAVWNKFLPSDHMDIISRSSLTPPPFPSKKQLYMWLSDNHVFIDHGTKSFSIEKRSGKRGYVLGARDLGITWGDTPQYWSWTSLPDSKFAEVAELISVCWLEIHGKININLLSPNTTYTAFLVYKLGAQTYGFEHKHIEVSVGVEGNTTTNKVCLNPPRGPLRHQRRYRGFPNILWDVLRGNVEDEVSHQGFYPKMRGDGWMEFDLGNYFNYRHNYSGDDLDEVGNMELEISLMEVKNGDWKKGLIVQGIEIRPKLT